MTYNQKRFIRNILLRREYHMSLTIKDFSGKYEFLWNGFESPVPYEGITYCSVENAFQASKTKDETVRRLIASMSPSKAHNYGKQLTTNESWEKEKITIMRTLTLNKFMYEEKLTQSLLATDYRTIVRSNTWGDVFWGMCNGKGENYSGIILEDVRSILAKKFCDIEI